MTAARIVLVVVIATTAILGTIHFASVEGWILAFDSRAAKEFLLSDPWTLVLFWLGLGYFWLALGYFENRRLIRRNAAALKKASQDAAAALEIIEVEAHRQRHYHRT